MKKYLHIASVLLSLSLLVSSCNLNRFPETQLAEKDFWKTESDFKGAANQLYALLQPTLPDFRGDDLFMNNYPDDISAGTRKMPAESKDWTKPYEAIFVCNRIIEHAPDENATIPAINRYVSEAYFFRAYFYHILVKKFGGVPLLKRTANDIGDELLYTPRSTREESVNFIYSDLDRAIKYLPLPSDLAEKDYGRTTRTAALALKARVGLYEGTLAKFHSQGDPTSHLTIAVEAAATVMSLNEHDLYTKGSDPYKAMFVYEGEGASNKENIFAKLYGYPDNLLFSHNIPYGLAVNYGVSRNFLNLYLTGSGLPFVDQPSRQYTYNDYYTDRDPRLTRTMLRKGEDTYQFGAYIPYNNSKTAFGIQKFVVVNVGDQPSTLDFTLIRYAEVLLTYAEAKFELNGLISDDDLDASINKLRKRVGFNVSLSNVFVTDNGLDMRTEIRRERTVELALEGFRYDDLIRWKTAEQVLPVDVLGAKFVPGEWGSAGQGTLENKLDENNVLIVEEKKGRFFDTSRDYLYPIPSNDIAQSRGTLKQNPNWK